VHVIASAARELSERSLHRRIELDPPPDELGELVHTFNAMLARLEAAFESLRRFTADAAH
jgi:HAMP domain-containing protein